MADFVVKVGRQWRLDNHVKPSAKIGTRTVTRRASAIRPGLQPPRRKREKPPGNHHDQCSCHEPQSPHEIEVTSLLAHGFAGDREHPHRTMMPPIQSTNRP